MKNFFAPFFLVLLFATFAAGCGGPNSAMVGLQVELTAITRNSAGTQVTWRIVNPNIVPYLVARTNHRIYLDGVLVGTVDDREALAVPAQNRPERTATLSLAGPAAENALAAAAGRGSAAYRLESVVTIRLYGENLDKSELRASGAVTVK